MAGRTMTAQQFADYARSQIRAAETILAQHEKAGPSCRCGRAWPCPQADMVTARRDHFASKLALAEKTQVLPVVDDQPTAAEPHTGSPRWRARIRLLGRKAAGCGEL